MNLVELREIEMRFGERCVLSQFNFSIQPGERVAIVGASGSGKSTLLNIIGLLLKPTSGERIHFGERNLSLNGHKAMKLLRTKISYLFQDYALVDTDSVQKNMDLATRYLGRTAHKQALVQEALERVGLKGLEGRRVSTLSGGEQQRLALARLLVKPSELILADEPTGNLDQGNAQMVMEELKRLTSSGKSLVMVTHDLSLRQAFDRVIELK